MVRFKTLDIIQGVGTDDIQDLRTLNTLLKSAVAYSVMGGLNGAAERREEWVAFVSDCSAAKRDGKTQWNLGIYESNEVSCDLTCDAVAIEKTFWKQTRKLRVRVTVLLELMAKSFANNQLGKVAKCPQFHN